MCRILNMCYDAVMEGFWILQDSKYGRFQHMQAMHKVLNMPEYGWIMPYGRVLNMPGQRFTGFYMVCGFRALWYRFCQKHQKNETPQGNILESFLLDTLETTFWMENLTQRWIQSEPFKKSGHLFRFSKRAGETSSPPLVACVSVTEYASISLNMPNYPWKWLNTLLTLLGLRIWMNILHV